VPNIVVDAGPLIALLRPSDRHHKTAVAFLDRSDTAKLISNMLVVGEVAAILGNKHAQLVECLNWILANIEIDRDAGADLPRSIEVIEKYRDLPADLADASLVALCERLGTNLVASIDNDFEVYRLAKNKPFKNVFWPAST
jgi:uncharacterized protein